MDKTCSTHLSKGEKLMGVSQGEKLLESHRCRYENNNIWILNRTKSSGRD